MTQNQSAPTDSMAQTPESIEPVSVNKFSRKTMLKDREDSLRANLLKRKAQQKTKQQMDETND